MALIGGLISTQERNVPVPIITGVPDQVTNVKLWSPGTPQTLYATFPMPINGSSNISQFSGVLSPSGVVGIPQTRFTAGDGDPFDALTCRVEFSGVPSGAQTATIRATNSQGPGAFSVASNSISATQFSGDTWVDGSNCHFMFCGGSIIGLNPLWHDGYFDNQTLPIRYVSPGTSTTTNPGFNSTNTPTMNAPAYPTGLGLTNQLMAEMTSQSQAGYGALVNIFLDNGPAGQNGAFNANPYSRFVFYVFPAQGNTPIAFGTETAYFIEGQVSAATSTLATFANQTFVTNTFPAGSSAFIDRTTVGITSYISNTATVVTTGGSIGTAVNDYACIGVGDVSVPASQISDISSFVISPAAGSVTVGQWNRVEIPLSSTGILAMNQGRSYKVGIGFFGGSGTTTGKSANYLMLTGWAV